MANITLQLENHIAYVTLARPEKLNALTFEMLRELVAVGESLILQDDLRAVVLAAEGKAFCAGLDVTNFAVLAGMDSQEQIVKRTHGNANLFQQASLVWRKIPVPVICALQGVVFGGGLQIALGADVRFASPDVKMSIMEMKWGIVPDMGGMTMLPYLLRSDVLRLLTYTAEPFDVAQALEWGLVTEIYEDPIAEARKTAQEIAMKSPSAIRAAKRLIGFAEANMAQPDTVLMEESREQAALIGEPDQMEVIAAELGKRAPNFG